MIPAEMRDRAEKLCAFLEAMPSEGNIAAIEAALMEERDRCMAIANGWIGANHDGCAEDIFDRILAGDTTQERTP